MAQEITRTECRCDERHRAQGDAEFVYLPYQRAWVFPDRVRQMSAAARYYAFSERPEFPHRDHSGEYYTFRECPFCGHPLPGTAEVPRIAPPTTSEGPET